MKTNLSNEHQSKTTGVLDGSVKQHQLRNESEHTNSLKSEQNRENQTELDEQMWGWSVVVIDWQGMTIGTKRSEYLIASLQIAKARSNLRFLSMLSRLPIDKANPLS